MEVLSLLLLALCILGVIVLFSKIAGHRANMTEQRKRTGAHYDAKDILLIVVSLFLVAASLFFSVFRAVNASATESELSAARTGGYADGYDAGEEKGYSDGYKAGNRQASRSDSGGNGGSNAGSSRADPISNGYIGNKNTKKYHCSSCSYLPDKGNQIVFDSSAEAEAAGYSPCGHCNP